MNPILASGPRLIAYLGFWLLIATMLATVYASASAASATEAMIVVVPLTVVYAFVCLSAWYVCRVTPLNVAAIGRIIWTHAVAAALATAAWLVTWEGWVHVLADDYAQSVEHFRSQFVLIAAVGILLFWTAAMFHYVLIAFEESRLAITRGLELEVMAREAELKALRAQIDPHFLFNSLNSISALTATDPAGARQMCVLLAAFFRSSVRLGSQERVPLEQEIDMVRNFLAIEKIRCGSRLSTAIEVGAGCENCSVPPLILQPLVENAVRHGVHSHLDGGSVAVRAQCDGGSLSLSIENPFDEGAQSTKGTGVGLKNVRRRLRALFDQDADLKIANSDGVYRVAMTLPCAECRGESDA